MLIQSSILKSTAAPSLSTSRQATHREESRPLPTESVTLSGDSDRFFFTALGGIFGFAGGTLVGIPICLIGEGLGLSNSALQVTFGASMLVGGALGSYFGYHHEG